MTEGVRLRRSGQRREILRAAKECLAARITRLVSLRSIAVRAGVSPAMVFHFFPDRASLIRRVAAEAMADLVPELPAVQPGSEEKALRVYAAACLESIARKGESLRLVLRYALSRRAGGRARSALVRGGPSRPPGEGDPRTDAGAGRNWGEA